MSWPGFYALSAAWLFLLVVPLVIMYFLKLKRPRVEVASLVLWQAVLQDYRVNSPFQKFKKNILLWLQLLALLLLILAAMQPYWRGEAEQVQNLPVLLDASASMAAADGPGGRSRFDIAREQIAKLVDDMPPQQRICLISFSSSARRLTDFTDNKQTLRDALALARVEDMPANTEDALRMTGALAHSYPFERAILFSDGNFAEKTEFDLPVKLDYRRVTDDAANVGVTAFSARRQGATQWDVFVRVDASKQANSPGVLQVMQDGNVVGEERVIVPPGGSQRLVFSIEAEGRSSLQLKLTVDGFDALKADNVAYLELPEAQALSVYVPKSMTAFRYALAGIQRSQGGLIRLFPDEQTDQTLAAYHLVISDNPADEALDAIASLFVGYIPEDLKAMLSIEDGPDQVVDWRRDAPLLQHVQLDQVIMLDKVRAAAEVGQQQLEQAGYEVLAEGTTGPLVLMHREGRRQRWHLLFHPDKSTLPYRVGFPIMMYNTVQLAMHASELSEVRAAPTGVLPALSLEPDTEYRIVGPDSGERLDRSDEKGQLRAIPAPASGVYEVFADGQKKASVGASLLDARETSLSSVEQMQFRELTVSATEAEVATDRPLWPLLALAAFGLLLVEWWFFQRRPGGGG